MKTILLIFATAIITFSFTTLHDSNAYNEMQEEYRAVIEEQEGLFRSVLDSQQRCVDYRDSILMHKYGFNVPMEK